ncbi:cystatin-A-like [Portunus trituberculatus]|uniref:Cystatin A n=1 Tax=Portunus trituberculatus TaxID=210409 RepID=I6XU08_PORTR|nr:cystatin-A-like [Portunus trituberculatus]AFN44699.1 cystatin A precursor [Portunus trituberculatus]
MTLRLCSVLFLTMVLVGECVEGLGMMVPGGTSPEKSPTPEVQAMVDAVKPQVEERLGRQVDQMTLLGFKTQVVAGINYFAKVDIGEDDVVHLRIYKGFDQNVELHGMHYPKGRTHPIEYIEQF